MRFTYALGAQQTDIASISSLAGYTELQGRHDALLRVSGLQFREVSRIVLEVNGVQTGSIHHPRAISDSAAAPKYDVSGLVERAFDDYLRAASG